MLSNFLGTEFHTQAVLRDVEDERSYQNEKWGQQSHPDGTGRPGDEFEAANAKLICGQNLPHQDNWRDILNEEVWEAFAETDPVRLREELVQVAAVAVAWIEAIDRREEAK